MHIYGIGFSEGVISVRLIQDNSPDIIGFNLNVFRDNYLTCDFDLDNEKPNTYSLLIEKSMESDTLRLCFFCNKKCISPVSWHVFFSFYDSEDWFDDIVYGNPDNDNENEIYIKASDECGKMVQISYQLHWILDTILYKYESVTTKLIIIDGDNDGNQEIYKSYYQIKNINGSWVVDNSIFNINGGCFIEGVTQIMMV